MMATVEIVTRLILDGWWIWFFLSGLLIWAISYRPLLYWLRWGNLISTRTFLILALNVLAFAAIGSSLYHVYTQPVEALMLTPTPVQDQSLALLQEIYIAFVTVSGTLILKPFAPIIAFLILGTAAAMTMEDMVKAIQYELSRWRQNRLTKQTHRLDTAHTQNVRTYEGLLRMPWRDFEKLCVQFFTALGYEAKLTRSSKDGGVDLYLTKGDHRAVVQCKRYAPDRGVGRPAVQQLYGVMHEKRADYAYFVTTGHFSGPAQRFAREHPTMRLIDGKQFVGLGQKLGVLRKN